MMKYISSLLLLMSVLYFSSCGECTCDHKASGGKSKAKTIKLEENGIVYRGFNKIDASGAIPMTALAAKLGDQAEIDVKVSGKIDAVCKTSGCWIDIANGDEEPIKVLFKDYAFFMPKDIGGKQATMQGRAYYDTISVKKLRHFAEDADLPQSEIDQITEPKIALAFEAESVMIQ